MAGFVPIGSTSPPANLRFFTAFDGDPEIDLPESRERRLLEMRLMQNYIWNMAKPFAVHPNKEWGDMFERTIPAMALENDNLMSSLMVVSASNLLMKNPDDPVLLDAQRTYLVKAVREQRIMIDALSVETADPICMTSLFLLTHSFASLRDRPLEPYTPPLRWLHMGRGAGVLIWMSVNTLNKAGLLDTSRVLFVAGSYPRLGFDESYFDESMRRDFNGLLSQKLPGSRDVWDDETRDTYEKTLSYVGSIQNAINKQEPAYAICRRIKAFPLIATPKFTSFVEECRPRALTILAHYFATTIQVQGPWWLGAAEGGREGMAQREIRAIAKALPPEWQAQMVWPLDIASVR